ncbi:hypothetical protein I79_011368 [Cricetulus griseus]|uniref:Uncharacterized protein n=1 Tax=Cricetulus griseus TaxID=10029 RepID=G3HKY5_CRIGR|nr:hypothetical protein I79_011368 [Cricetulus griseus]
MKTGKARYKPSEAHARLNLLVITFIFKHNQNKKRKLKTFPFSLFPMPCRLLQWIGSIFRVERVLQEESSAHPLSG